MASCRRQLRQAAGAPAAMGLGGLLLLLLAAATRAQSAACPQASMPTTLPAACTALPRVCVDHSVFVLYESRHNPRHALFAGLPRLQPANITLDYYGFGDVWDTAFVPPGPLLRPATAGEETRELAAPQFSVCALPLVIYAHHLYHYGDFFVNTVAALHMLQLNRTLDKGVSLVVETFGQQLEPWHRFLLAPFSRYRVTTLSHLSSRLPPGVAARRAEGYGPDGHHVRCYRQLLLCQMRGSGSAAAASLARGAPVPHPLWFTGRAIFQHYKRSLPPIDPEFADASKLRVLIAALPRQNKIRAIVNQEQVWSWCTKFQPPQGVVNWNGTSCLLHEFGRNLMSDLAYTSQADVLIGLHGDALYNALFMRHRASVVEVRPRGFAGRAASRHMKEVAAADGHSLFWWGINIVNPAHSAPGLLEAQKRGRPSTWPRERHVFLRLMACQYILERIALTRTNGDTYATFRARREHFITDMLQPASDDDGGLAAAAAAAAAAATEAGGGGGGAGGAGAPPVQQLEPALEAAAGERRRGGARALLQSQPGWWWPWWRRRRRVVV